MSRSRTVALAAVLFVVRSHRRCCTGTAEVRCFRGRRCLAPRYLHPHCPSGWRCLGHAALESRRPAPQRRPPGSAVRPPPDPNRRWRGFSPRRCPPDGQRLGAAVSPATLDRRGRERRAPSPRTVPRRHAPASVPLGRGRSAGLLAFDPASYAGLLSLARHVLPSEGSGWQAIEVRRPES